MGDLYEFAAATRDVPWHEAEACGWLNCADAGGWLRLLPSSALVIEQPDEAAKSMLPTLRSFQRASGHVPWPDEQLMVIGSELLAAVGKEEPIVVDMTERHAGLRYGD